MTIKGLAAGIALMLLVMAAPAKGQDKLFRQKVYDASVQLYILEADQQNPGKQYNNPACTATAFEKTPKGYHLLTAAHCVLNPHEGLFPYDEPAPDGTLSVGYGDPGDPRALIPAKLLMIGNFREGWDCAVLNIDTTASIPVIPLGDETKVSMGDKLVSVSAPVGGQVKYWYEGYMSATRQQVDPELSHEYHNWKFPVLIQMPGAEGSSGAAVIAVDQQAIIGVYTSIVRGASPMLEYLSTTIMPVSAIKEFISNSKLHLSLGDPDPKK